MTYVEGRFSDRRSKRTALMVLGAVFALSCARGVVGSFPSDDQAGPLAPEPGVALAVPIRDLGPEPTLQAELKPTQKVRGPSRPRWPRPVAPVELAASAGETATPVVAVTGLEIVPPTTELELLPPAQPPAKP